MLSSIFLISNSTPLDLLVLGIVVASNALLGFITFYNEPKNITHRYFLYLALSIIFYSTPIYFTYRISDLGTVLFLERLVMFFSVPFAMYIFLLIYNFPFKEHTLSLAWRLCIYLVSLTIMALTLSPYVFTGINGDTKPGIPPIPNAGWGIYPYALTVLFYDLGGLFLIIKKSRTAQGSLKNQYKYLLFGFLAMLGLIIIFSFVFPAFLGNTNFIKLSVLFTLPFVFATSYAIIKHGLFNVKVIATELLTFGLWVLLLLRAVAATSLSDTILSTIVFIASIALGILLIKSVLQEVKSREQVQRLALDLEIANRDLKRLDEAKSDFISIASHQLRTPLSIIKGYISMVREGTYGPVDSKLLDPLHKVYVSNERLINLVSDLLDLSRMERGRMQYQFEVIHLSDVVEGLVDDFAVVAKNKGLAFEWKKGDAKDVIKGDANKLRQVVLNLIDNAIKYTPAGKITVSTSQEGQTIVLSVTDTGPGLSADESHALFKKFSRGREEKSMHTEGTGLGLYVAKLIAQAHGGDLSVTSPGKGLGSTFSLAVPLYNDSQEKIETFVSNL